MISVIVPIKDEPPGAAASFERFASMPGAELIVVDAREGTRGACLARAACEARGSVFFFVHADSTPPENALDLIREEVTRGAAAGAFSLAYEDADPPMRWIAWWANLRSRLLRLPYGDQGIFCRRDAYEAAGGFRPLPICDDLDLVRRLRGAGRFVIRPEVTVTSARRYRARGPLRQVLRVWKVVGGYFLGVSPERLERWYYGSR
jgi:hypothetical protein